MPIQQNEWLQIVTATPWIGDQWHVSRYAYEAGARADFRIPDAVTVIDCTLREGEQQAGVVISPEAKVQLARSLDAAGIPEIEVGMPAISDLERETIGRISREGLRANLAVICRAMRQDIDWAVDCGVDRVAISIPIGYLQLEHKLRWPMSRIIETAVELSNYAKDSGLRVTMSPYDTTRSNPEDLSRFLEELDREGHMDRVRLVDTVGAASPEAVAFLVGFMRERVDVQIEVHCHNDLGLATANTLAGVVAGAQVVSTTLNGMGERAGNAATEEVVLALRLLYGVETGISHEMLYRAADLLQTASGARIDPHKPLFGEQTFDQEAGTIVAGFLAEPLVALPFYPELLGRTSRIRLGKKSGGAAVKAKLEAMGLYIDESEVDSLLGKIKELAEELGRALDDSEIRSLVDRPSGSAAAGGMSRKTGPPNV